MLHRWQRLQWAFLHAHVDGAVHTQYLALAAIREDDVYAEVNQPIVEWKSHDKGTERGIPLQQLAYAHVQKGTQSQDGLRPCCGGHFPGPDYSLNLVTATKESTVVSFVVGPKNGTKKGTGFRTPRLPLQQVGF